MGYETKGEKIYNLEVKWDWFKKKRERIDGKIGFDDP